MRSVRHALGRMSRVALTTALAVVGLPLVASTANTASADVTFVCTPAVTVFGVNTADTMWVNDHNDPENSGTSWTGRGHHGSTWSGRVLAGANNQVFTLPGNGPLYRKTWTGTGFSAQQTLSTNAWHGWTESAHENRITVDANNHFYYVLGTGALEVKIYNESAGTWTTKELATGWSKYDLIFAAGDGVIYARDPLVGNGTLYRYQYDVDTAQWLGYNRQLPGGGWNIHRQIFSPGADIIYGLASGSGTLTEYRYDPHSNTWPGGGTQVGTGWGTIRYASAVTTNCSSTTPADAVVQCTPKATIFGVNTVGTMWVHEHNEPETGVNDFRSPGQYGEGYDGRVFTGSDGTVYRQVDTNGTLLRRVWNGVNGFGNEEILESGRWYGWSLPANENRITADANNHVYTVLDNGNLEVNAYDANKAVTTRTLDVGWGKYNLIFAAGDGVIYARNATLNGGGLYRYQYDFDTNRWLEYDRQVPGGGWNIHRQIFSPGGDVIYGITSDTGKLVEYRFNPATNTWPIGAADLTTGWGTIKYAGATTNGCTLKNQPTIQLPNLPLAAPNYERPATVHNAAQTRTEAAHVENSGVLMTARKGSAQDAYPYVQGISVGGTFTGRAAIGLRSDGKTVVIGREQSSAKVYAYVRTDPGTDVWSAPKVLHGEFASSPVLARAASGKLTVFAVDVAGKLWFSQDQTIPGDFFFTPWRKAAGTITMSTDFSVATTGGEDFEIVYRDTNNAVAVSNFGTGTLASARTAPGLTAAGVPSGVVVGSGTDKRTQVVVRGSDNKIYTQKETATGFTGWTDISNGGTFRGSPSILLNTWGLIEVAARQSGDGLVLRSGQTAAGSSTWRGWEEVGGTAYTDPSFAAMAGTQQRIFFENDGGEPTFVDATAYSS